MNSLKARHFLQSSEWALFQKNLGNSVIERSGDGWLYVAIVEIGHGTVGKQFKRLYCPYGPYYTSKTALTAALKDLEDRAKILNIDYVRVEPTTNGDCSAFNGQKFGYSLQKRDFQPRLGLLIDLRPSFDEIMSSASKTNRYLWHKKDKNHLSFKISYDMADLEAFILIMRETADRTQTTFHRTQFYELLLESLGPTKNIGVAYAYHEDEVLVGVMFADDFVNKTRYYLYAGSFDKARKYSANSPLVSYLLKDAKEHGLETFDFFGIVPESATKHRWAGFSKFKRSFGGEEFAFSGTWEKPIRPLRYKVMQLARTLKP